MNLQKLLISLCLLTLTFGCDIGGGQFTASKPVGGQIEVSADPGTQAFLARSGFLGSASINDRAIGASRYLVYHSSQDLLPNDSNGQSDIYLRDTLTGTSSLISLSTANVQGDGASTQASISADGRYVVFRSAATNLVTGDTNGVEDIFMRDTLAGTTVRVSLGSGTTQATGTSLTPAVSNGGRYVVFASEADNLVTGDNNAQPDIFVRDTQSNTTTLISSTSIGLGSANGASFDPATTPDGAFIAFSSEATNVIAGGLSGRQVLRVERATPTNRVLVSQNGAQANGPCYEPSMSNDGNIIAFFSNATNLGTDSNAFFDVYVRDITAETTTRVSVASTGETDNHSGFPSISGDGSIVAFGSIATNLVAGDGNGVFDVFTRTATTTTRVSVNSAGGQANIDSDLPAISLDGTRVAFRSAATDLVPQDNVADDDIFMHHLASATTVLQSLACKFPPVDPTKGVDKDYPLANNAETVLSGDLDGDGDIDLLTVHNTGQLLSILKNDGQGNFAASTTTGGASESAFRGQLGDIDGDGDLDLVSYHLNGDPVRIYLNDGNGTFSFSTGLSILNSDHLSVVALEDVDKDGDLDITCSYDTFGGASPHGVAVFKNTRTSAGQVSFDPPVLTSSTLAFIFDIAFGDVDGDTNLDLVVTGDLAELYLGDGSGSFAFDSYISGAESMNGLAIGDIDGDTHQDLVGLQQPNIGPRTPVVYPNNGTGGFGSSTEIDSRTLSRPSYRDLKLQDIDADGDLDIVAVGGSRLGFYINDGDGTFPTSNLARVIPGNGSLTLGDFDGDLDIDVATADVNGSFGSSARVLVLLEQLNPHFPRLVPGPVTPPSVFLDTKVADFNRDGRPDILSVGSELQVHTYTSAGSLSLLTSLSLSNNQSLMEVTDLNQDGNLDVLTIRSSPNNNLITDLRSSPSGTFSINSTIDVGFIVFNMTAADLNHDGFPELIVTGAAANSLRVYQNDGLGNLISPPISYPGGRAFQVGDVDQDGDLDIVASNTGLLVNDGSGALTETGNLLPESGSSLLTDANGNGRLDLVTSFGYVTQISLNAGGGTFSSPTAFATGVEPARFHGPRIIALDMDGDGDQDLVTYYRSSLDDSLAVILNKGNGEFALSTDYFVDESVFSVAAGDYDGDGDLDLVSTTGDSLKTLLNQLCP